MSNSLSSLKATVADRQRQTGTALWELSCESGKAAGTGHGSKYHSLLIYFCVDKHAKFPSYTTENVTANRIPLNRGILNKPLIMLQTQHVTVFAFFSVLSTISWIHI